MNWKIFINGIHYITGEGLKLPHNLKKKGEALNKNLPDFHYPTKNFT